jgi:hypothetical protein
VVVPSRAAFLSCVQRVWEAKGPGDLLSDCPDVSVFAEPLALVRSALRLDVRVPGGNDGPLAALDLIEQRAGEMEKALRPFVEDYDFHAADYLAELVDGEEARVLTARTVESLMAHQRAARAALSARQEAQ